MADAPTHPSDTPEFAAGTHQRPNPGPENGSTDASDTPPPGSDGEQSAGLSAASRGPLITAVEIENFKGIGHPVRIDLRPITLLFGRNSAGKSTLLHALCYAHEILSHRSVDVRKTDLGGDQIDMGGFGQFVHRHDLRRRVRLRFDLSLEGWQVPAPVREKMRHSDEAADEGPERDDLARFIRSGWVSLTVAWNGWKEKPMLARYEIGVNDSLVGRIIQSPDPGEEDVNLEFNRGHPLFDQHSRDASARSYAVAGQVGEAADPGAEWSLRSIALSGQTTPLPDWDALLRLNDGEVLDTLDIGIVGEGPKSLIRFQSLVSALFVGVGRTLRDELAALRYVGPMRELRPSVHAEVGSPAQDSWSDGTAAWNLLLYPEPDPVRQKRGLIDEVNDWLERRDRLDIGYKLLRKAFVELPADEAPVWWIRTFAWLPDEYRNEDGEVDLDGWVRKEAAKMADRVEGDPTEIEARITGGSHGTVESGDTDTDSSDQGGSVADSMEATRRQYQILANIVAPVDKLKRGRPASAVRDLVGAIASASERTILELVAVGSNVGVRTSDVGTGISQILPVVVAALDPNRPGITAVEQPELHVHPRLQVELGDLFAQRVDQGGISLLETHSEHLMLRLLRRIEETGSGELPEGKPPLKPDQVSVVYVEQSDGEVRATRLRIDETGEFIDRWPQGFFDERDDELF